MNDTRIYVKGKPGFKPAVRSKLGETWNEGSSDMSVDTIMFLLPAEIDNEAFKTLIGEELTSTYSLQFNTDPDKYFRIEKPYSMTIWASNESKIRERENQKPEQDLALRVF